MSQQLLKLINYYSLTKKIFTILFSVCAHKIYRKKLLNSCYCSPTFSSKPVLIGFCVIEQCSIAAKLEISTEAPWHITYRESACNIQVFSQNETPPVFCNFPWFEPKYFKTANPNDMASTTLNNSNATPVPQQQQFSLIPKIINGGIAVSWEWFWLTFF